MKEKADTPRPRKTAKTTTKTADKAKAPAAKTASAKASTAKTPRSKKTVDETAVVEKKSSRVSRSSGAKKATSPAVAADDVAVAAFLNWCQRRNQTMQSLIGLRRSRKWDWSIDFPLSLTHP
jgi:plasmid replication initiation protein